MKKLFVAALAAIAILAFASSSFALLCASDPVPAGTILYPFMTATYSATSTSEDPKVDMTKPYTLFSVTNISNTPRIVHFVLWNDMSAPVLDWDVLLTGYDVWTQSFARLIEGYIQATGVDLTSTSPSPVGSTPPAQGPVAAYFAGIPALPAPGAVGFVTTSPSWNGKNSQGTAARPHSVYGLCTNGVYTLPQTKDPVWFKDNRIPAFNREYMTGGLQQSQLISENGWWGSFDSSTGVDFLAPDWLLARTRGDGIWAYITADVVNSCNDWFGDRDYIMQKARPYTWDWYANNAATNYRVWMGNTIIGDWLLVDDGLKSAEGNNAVHVETDNQDVTQWWDTVNNDGYPKRVQLGRSFYRYFEGRCGDPWGLEPPDYFVCFDVYTGTGEGEYWTTMGGYMGEPALGGNIGFPVPDFREPLPSAFAFRYMDSDAAGYQTKVRVWKETTDLLPYYGFTYVYAGHQYTYYSWDEMEQVIGGGSIECPVSPCPGVEAEDQNNLPLELQEVDIDDAFNVPADFGWVLLAFFGSNGFEIDFWNTDYSAVQFSKGTQAWVDVQYTADNAGQKYALDMNAAILGNFLCDGYAIVRNSPWAVDAYWHGRAQTDLGDILY